MSVESPVPLARPVDGVVVVEDDSPDDLRVLESPSTVSLRRRPALVLAELLAVLGSPVVLFYVLQVEPYFRQNGLDPYMYLGYSQEPGDLINRYGLTYYSVRFGLLWPIEITTKLFGVTGGFFVMRWALAVVSGGSVYLLFRKYGNRWLGFAAMTLYLASPVLLRALMTSYSDTTGVPYLTAAAAAMLLSTTMPVTWRRHLLLVWSGCLFGLAIHSNPFLLVLSGCMVFGWSVCVLTLRRWRLVVDWLWLGAGVGLVSLAGVVVYWVRFDRPNIFAPSIDAITSLSGQNGEAFRSTTGLWESYQLQLYLGPLVLAAWAATLWRRGRRPERAELATMAMLVLFSVFFLYHQFIGGSTTLETYYYSSYLWPVVALAAGFVVVALFQATTSTRLAALFAVTVVALPLARNLFWRDLSLTRWPWVPVAIAVTCVLALVLRPSGLRAYATATVFASSSFLLMLAGPRVLAPGSLFHPAYDAAIGNQDWSGLDTYKLTYDLMGFTPDLSQRDGTLLFWYNSTIYPWVGSVHGAFVAFSSSIDAGSPQGMPYLDDWRIAHLWDEKARRLELLGTTQAEIDEATAALRARGVPIDRMQDAELTSGPYALYVRLLTVHQP
jgi:hypothetical protein